MVHDPQARPFPHRSVLGIGEAMIEFASLGGEHYRRGFAGDSLNTCWHMAQLLGPHVPIGYCTRVGTDVFSEEFLAFMASSGIDTRHVARDAQRTLGLYVIRLHGAERQFSFWREASAARRLADDAQLLRDAMRGQGLIHLSGITLAVVGPQGRNRLIDALAQARDQGAVVSFDPNLRLSLWPDVATLQDAMQAVMEVVDIALPTFDDEARLWGDADPRATVERLLRAGVGEIVVKNGPEDLVFASAGQSGQLPTPPVQKVLDTTGAGDAFNAGYLSARLAGMAPAAACQLGQAVAGEVIGHHGALAPAGALAEWSRALCGRLVR
jgi:2-dehydro-3-deoxygluconokinase